MEPDVGDAGSNQEVCEIQTDVLPSEENRDAHSRPPSSCSRSSNAWVDQLEESVPAHPAPDQAAPPPSSRSLLPLPRRRLSTLEVAAPHQLGKETQKQEISQFLEEQYMLSTRHDAKKARDVLLEVTRDGGKRALLFSYSVTALLQMRGVQGVLCVLVVLSWIQLSYVFGITFADQALASEFRFNVTEIRNGDRPHVSSVSQIGVRVGACDLWPLEQNMSNASVTAGYRAPVVMDGFSLRLEGAKAEDPVSWTVEAMIEGKWQMVLRDGLEAWNIVPGPERGKVLVARTITIQLWSAFVSSFLASLAVGVTLGLALLGKHDLAKTGLCLCLIALAASQGVLAVVGAVLGDPLEVSGATSVVTGVAVCVGCLALRSIERQLPAVLVVGGVVGIVVSYVDEGKSGGGVMLREQNAFWMLLLVCMGAGLWSARRAMLRSLGARLSQDAAAFAAAHRRALAACEEGDDAVEELLALCAELGVCHRCGRRQCTATGHEVVQTSLEAGEERTWVQRVGRVWRGAFWGVGRGKVMRDMEQLLAQASAGVFMLRAKAQELALVSEGCFPLTARPRRRAKTQGEGHEGRGVAAGLAEYALFREVVGQPARLRLLRWTPLKPYRRALEKALLLLDGQSRRVLDACRESIVFESFRDIASCLRAMQRDPEIGIKRVTNTLGTEADVSSSAGFRAVFVKLVIRSDESRRLGIDSHVCELILTLRCIAELVSDKSHKDYLLLRRLEAASRKRERDKGAISRGLLPQASVASTASASPSPSFLSESNLHRPTLRDALPPSPNSTLAMPPPPFAPPPLAGAEPPLNPAELPVHAVSSFSRLATERPLSPGGMSEAHLCDSFPPSQLPSAASEVQSPAPAEPRPMEPPECLYAGPAEDLGDLEAPEPAQTPPPAPPAQPRGRRDRREELEEELEQMYLAQFRRRTTVEAAELDMWWDRLRKATATSSPAQIFNVSFPIYSAMSKRWFISFGLVVGFICLYTCLSFFLTHNVLGIQHISRVRFTAHELRNASGPASGQVVSNIGLLLAGCRLPLAAVEVGLGGMQLTADLENGTKHVQGFFFETLEEGDGGHDPTVFEWEVVSAGDPDKGWVRAAASGRIVKRDGEQSWVLAATGVPEERGASVEVRMNYPVWAAVRQIPTGIVALASWLLAWLSFSRRYKLGRSVIVVTLLANAFCQFWEAIGRQQTGQYVEIPLQFVTAVGALLLTATVQRSEKYFVEGITVYAALLVSIAALEDLALDRDPGRLQDQISTCFVVVVGLVLLAMRTVAQVRAVLSVQSDLVRYQKVWSKVIANQQEMAALARIPEILAGQALERSIQQRMQTKLPDAAAASLAARRVSVVTGVARREDALDQRKRRRREVELLLARSMTAALDVKDRRRAGSRPVESLSLLYTQAAGLHPLVLRKVQEWAGKSQGRFATRRSEGEASEFVLWAECERDPEKAASIRWGSLKREERAVEKLLRSYGGMVWELQDLVRQSVVFHTAEELVSCLAVICEDPEVRLLAVKNRLCRDYDPLKSAGYRDVHLNLVMQTSLAEKLGVDCHIFEVQLQLVAYADTKIAGGHKRYVAFRNALCI